MNPLTLLTGYRTLIAGIGLIGLGVYEMTEGKVDVGAAHIAEGLACIGFGGKLERVVDAMKSQTGPAPRE